MINLLWSAVFMLLLLSGCGWSGTPTRNNDFTPLTSIEISAVLPTIAAGTSTKLSVIGNFSGLFTRDITDQVVWSSDSTTIAGFATAASPNRVTGHVPGTAILTATVGSVASTFTLTVSSATITALTITPAAPTISKGLNTQFAVSGAFSDATTQDLTIDATWASSVPIVATVSDAVGSKGFAQALTIGPSTISATFGGISGTVLLTVTEPVVLSIALLPADPSILTLSTGSFKATGTYSDGSTADITSLATWSSSQPGIAAISAGGAAKTLTQGTTSISATLNGVPGTTTLKVTGGNLTGFTVSPATVTLVNNSLVRMTAIGSFSNGASRDITGVVVWSVTNPALATVAAPGGNLALLNSLAVTGVTTVTATSGTLPPATTNLTVTAPSLLSIAISPVSLDLTAGTSARLTLTATFNDVTTPTQNVTDNTDWTSSDASIATVENIELAKKGQVSGITAGTTTTTITAKYVGAGGVTVTAPITVTVTARTLQSLTISPTATTVGSGNQVTFTATAIYTDGTTKDVTEDTAWTIDTSNFAKLADSQNQPGQVVGIDIGSATLTAIFGGKTQTALVTVP